MFGKGRRVPDSEAVPPMSHQNQRQPGWFRRRKNAPSASTAEDTYDAFISYSHGADDAVAVALQRALHQFAKPWYRMRSLHVFRDQASLSADPRLWSSIETALAGSRSFILLASPEAAASPWVGREAKWWTEHNGTAKFLVALTSGELAWDDERVDFDWGRTTALPAPLRGVFQEEPRYIDMRWTRAQHGLSLDDAQFREAVADLAAPLHGRPKDALIGEDVRQHRRARRLAWSVSALLFILATATGAGALFAIDQRDQARGERDIATSRQLAAQSFLEADDRWDRALLLAVQAVNVAPTLEARSALLQSVEQYPELVSLLHQDGEKIESLAGSVDGRTLAAASGDEIFLWDVPNRRRRSSPLRHGDKVTTVAFSNDGTTVFSGGQDGRVISWDSLTGLPKGRALRHSGAVNYLAVSSDGILAALVDNKSVVLWDAHNRLRLGDLESDVGTPPESAGHQPVLEESSPAEHQEAILSLAFSPDGKTLATGGDVQTIRFWDVPTRRPNGRPIQLNIGDYSQQVGAMSFNHDGTVLATGGGGQGLISVWDIERRELTAVLKGHTDIVTSLAFDASDQLASASLDRTVLVWDINEGSPKLGPLPGYGIAGTVLFLEGSEALVSASDEGVIVTWDTAGRNRLRMGTALAEGASAAADQVVFTPDGRTLAAVVHGEVRLWDVTTASEETQPGFPASMVKDIAFAGDGSVLAAGTDTGSIVLWDIGEQKELPGPVLSGAAITALAVPSTDGSRLATVDEDGLIRLWDLSTDWATEEPLFHGGPVTALAYSPDGEALASAGRDGQVVLWDTRTRQRRGSSLLHPPGVNALAFSHDGSTLASAGEDGRVVLWDVESRRSRGDLPAGKGQPVFDVAFSSDERTLATAGGASVILWDTLTRRELGRPLAGTRDLVVSVAYSPGGAYLAWGSFAIEPSSELLVLWDAREKSWEEQACSLAGRDLSQAEWSRFVGDTRRFSPACSESDAARNGNVASGG